MEMVECEALEVARAEGVAVERMFSRGWWRRVLRMLGWAGVAAGAFHGAYMVPGMGFLQVFVGYGLIRMAEISLKPRGVFYVGMLAGMGMYVPHLWFFWS